jgi:uncharacterized protein (TIGR02231 family)
MHIVAGRLVTASLVVFARFAAIQARAANVEATSAVDAVTVYPDGAGITRAITVEIPGGDNTVVVKDFPLALDPLSLRVEGEADTKVTIGAIDTRPPRAAPPVNLPELDKRIEALKDERADLQGAIAAAAARRAFAVRFADASPAGIGDKGEARPIADCARPLPRLRRKWQQRTPLFATRSANSATSTARLPGWNRIARSSRRASSR